MIRKMITLCPLICFAAASIASPFPRGCEVTGFAFGDKHLILNDSGSQTLYLIQNRSLHTIELEHVEVKDVFMSPKLESKLASQNWGSFASDEQNMHFQCFIRDDSGRQPVNCDEVLDACQYPRVKFALSNMGNYWISTNKSQEQVIKETASKGIYLRW